MRINAALFALLIAGFTSCKKKTTGPVEPGISFSKMAPTTVRSGNSEDTVFIQFNVSDADGDLGNDPSSNNYDIYVKDSRDTTVNGFFFPNIPKEVTETGKGVRGVCTLRIYASLFLIKRTDLQHENGDTLHYEIYIKDKAQHTSNIIQTPNIYILP